MENAQQKRFADCRVKLCAAVAVIFQSDFLLKDNESSNPLLCHYQTGLQDIVYYIFFLLITFTEKSENSDLRQRIADISLKKHNQQIDW